MDKFIYLILICTLFTGIFQSSNGQEKSGYTNLSPEEFYVKMNEKPGAVVLDTRLEPDYNEKRISGAHLVSGKDMLLSFVDTLAKDIPLFVYCYDGDRSKTACKILTRQLNFYNVYNLKEGIELWKKMNLPVDNKPTGIRKDEK